MPVALPFNGTSINCRFILIPFVLCVVFFIVENVDLLLKNGQPFKHCILIAIIQFVGFQHPNYVVIISILFDVFHVTWCNRARSLKKKIVMYYCFTKWLDEFSQKGCDLSLNHDIVHTVPCSHSHTPKLRTNTQNMFETNSLWKFIWSFDACFVWTEHNNNKESHFHQKGARLMGPFIISFLFDFNVLLSFVICASNIPAGIGKKEKIAVKLHICLTNFWKKLFHPPDIRAVCQTVWN